MSEQPMPIHRRLFIDSCVSRDIANGPMQVDGLLERLDIGMNELKRAIEANEKGLSRKGADCLRGYLIRLSQVISDPQVSAKVYEMVSITTDIPGL